MLRLFQFHTPRITTFSAPKSNEAQWITSGLYNDNQRAVMSETMILEPVLFTNSTGVFTIVGGDEWGDVLITHFSIVA